MLAYRAHSSNNPRSAEPSIGKERKLYREPAEKVSHDDGNNRKLTVEELAALRREIYGRKDASEQVGSSVPTNCVGIYDTRTPVVVS